MLEGTVYLLMPPVMAADLADVDIGHVPAIFLEYADDGILVGLGVVAGGSGEGLVIEQDDITPELVFVILAYLAHQLIQLGRGLDKEAFQRA